MHPLQASMFFALSSLALGDLLPGTCDVNRALGYFAGICRRQGPLPEACLPSIAEQATSFCNSFLSVEPATSYTTIVSTFGVIETTTELSAATTTTVESTTTTTTATEIVEAASTLVVTSTQPVTTSIWYKNRRAASSAASCTSLRPQRLTRLPAERVSSACSCISVSAVPESTTIATELSVGTSTDTVTATFTSTETITSTDVSTLVSSATTTLLDVSTTTTIVTATETVSTKFCNDAIAYWGVHPPAQYVFNNVGQSANRFTCCEYCANNYVNVVASVYGTVGPGVCGCVLNSVQALSGVTEWCPLGTLSTPYTGPPVNGGYAMPGLCGPMGRLQ